MTKFMVLYRSDVSARDQLAGATEEQAKAGMDPWMAWAAKAGEAIVDLGAPLAEAGYIGSGSGGGDSGHVTGFSILQAESADAIAGVLEGTRTWRWAAPSKCSSSCSFLACDLPGGG